jgi:Bifunctional DNA primase/polymerase, N-terminal
MGKHSPLFSNTRAAAGRCFRSSRATRSQILASAKQRPIRRSCIAGSAGYPYNIGIRTGIISGVFVLDIDGSNGAFSLADLERKHGPLPRTLTFTSAGCHFWFKCDRPIKTSVGQIATGIDIRGDGGIVVAPPSIHETGAIYRWSNESTPIAGAPAWLIELTRKKPISERALDNVRPIARSTGNAYGNAALDREIKALAATAPGARNHALNHCAFRLFQLVAGGELDRDQCAIA